MGIEDEVMKAAIFESTKQMLITLAIHYTEKTKLLEIPKGASSWVFIRDRIDKDDKSLRWYHDPIRDVVRLQPFFGMMVGYYEFGDVLVYWSYS